MTRSTLILAAGGVVLLAIFVLVFMWLSIPSGQSGAPITSPTGFPTRDGSLLGPDGTTTTPTGQSAPIADPYTVAARGDGPVVVEDFGAEQAPKDNLLYLFGGSETDKEPFSVGYFGADQSFTIALHQEPLGATRRAAEEALMEKLGIDQYGMCRLVYGVYVSIKVSEFYSGKNLGFSFCPGATLLP